MSIARILLLTFIASLAAASQAVAQVPSDLTGAMTSQVTTAKP